MAENPEFMKLLEKMREIHAKKVEDYSSVGAYQNFERQAEIISWFKADIDKAFAGLVAVKLARLATLLSSNIKSPNFESIDDSFLDLTTYCGLWASYYASVKVEDKRNSFINTSAIQGNPRCEHIWDRQIIPVCEKCNMKWSEWLTNPQ